MVKTTNAFRTLIETLLLGSVSCVGSEEELGMTSSGKIEITRGAIQKAHRMDTGRKSGAAKCSCPGTCPSRRGPRNPAQDAEFGAKHIATVFGPAFAPGLEHRAAFLGALRGSSGKRKPQTFDWGHSQMRTNLRTLLSAWIVYRCAIAGSCAALNAVYRLLISSQLTTFHHAARYSGRRLLYFR